MTRISKAKTPLLVLGFIGFLAGCGLGMSDEDRLDRASEAAANADYQAAIIDAKDVLRRDPKNMRARIILGRASLAVGDAASAEKELRRAVDLGANATELHIELVSSLVAQRKYQEALDAGLDPLLDSQSTAELRRLRGDTYRGLQQPANAIREYELALAENPDDVLAHLGIAISHLSANNPQQARSNLDALIEAYPDDIRVWLASGDLHRSSGSLDQAEANYRVVLDLSGPGDERRSDAVYGLAEIALARNDMASAEKYIDELAVLAPGSILTRLTQARLAVLNQDWGSAQTLLQEILRQAPDFTAAQVLSGAVAYQTGRYAQSEMYLSAVLAAEPSNAYARLLLTETYLALGRTDDARRTISSLDGDFASDPRVLAMSAKIALSSGDAELAISELEKSVEADPTNTAAQLQLALALIGAGRQDEVSAVLDRLATADGERTGFQRDVLAVLVQLRGGNSEAALSGARQVVRDWPDESGGYSLVGTIELANGELESAKSNFEEALDKNPENAVAERFLVQTAERLGEYDEAAGHYERIVDRDPSATWAMYGRARVAAAVQEFEVAAEWLERILLVEPSAVAPREALAQLHVQNGDLDSAAEVAADLVAQDPSRIGSHVLLGYVAMRAEDFAAAIDAFEDARRLDPGNAEVRLRLAEAQRLSGDQAAAIETLGGDEDIDYADLRTASATALAFANAGNFDRAIEIAQALQQTHPDSAAPIALEGEIWLVQGDLQQASAAYGRALAMGDSRAYTLRYYQVLSQLGDPNAQMPLSRYLESNPDDTVVRRLLAQHLNQAGSTTESISEYESIVATEAEDGVALNNLAWLYYTQGDSRAVETARKALDVLPDNWSVMDTLGWVLVETGEVEEGLDVLKQADDASGGEAVVRYHLAEAYARSGDRDTARRLLEELLTSGQEFDGKDDAERLLANL